MKNTDWEGKDVQPNESPETMIRVWCVSPHTDGSYDYCIMRSWDQVCDFIRETAESHLDEMGLPGEEFPTQKDPFVIKVWLEEMSKNEYDENTEVNC
jgi:hypothetical protein